MNDAPYFKLSRWFSGTSAPALFFVVTVVLGLSGCTELQGPKPEPYFAEATPPVRQEFRWSNGRLPTTFDPAKAASPPETDLVRAVFEGLTELDPATLTEVPAVAESWSSSEDHKTWTFVIRKDAKWSDGRPVIPDDFIRSWRRAAESPETIPHRTLFNNIVGMADLAPKTRESTNAPPTTEPGVPPIVNIPRPPPRRLVEPTPTPGEPLVDEREKPTPDPPVIGIEAADPRTLVVKLVRPDRDLPKLLAHPLFRPVPEGSEELSLETAMGSVTNGPFRISGAGPAGVNLERSETYWNRDAVKLERVAMVPAGSPEQVLEAYQNGQLDAVTNVELSPLVLKLLSPYDDFRRTSFAAVNLLELNPNSPALRDRRIRQALSMALDRERLAEAELEGTTRPAFSLIPFSSEPREELRQDKEKARDLFEEAGYPDGIGFPVLRLVVNRNDTQQRVAKAVAAMWNDNLNIGAEVIVRETSEIEEIRKTGDFDVLRRGVVLTTSDEFVNMRAIFGDMADRDAVGLPENWSGITDPTNTNTGIISAPTAPGTSTSALPSPIESERDALFELTAIPLYFPISFSLVKPYVDGFVMNSLDSPVLTGVAIKENWQPNTPNDES